MDGLLIDSEILWHEAEIEILGGLGVPLAVEGCRSTKGMFVGEVTAHWYGLHPWPGATPTPDEVAVSIVDRVIELIVTKGVLKPGAEHAIDLCRDRGLPLAVASSSQYRLIDAALAHFGLRDRFALVHSAEDEDYGKPHPAVFLTAATKLGAPAAPLPRVGGRTGRRAGGQGVVHDVHRRARAGRGGPSGVRPGRPRGGLAARGRRRVSRRARAGPRSGRLTQPTAWMRIMLPAGSRKAQSRIPYGWSVGSWTTSAPLACTRSKVPSRSVEANRIQP